MQNIQEQMQQQQISQQPQHQHCSHHHAPMIRPTRAGYHQDVRIKVLITKDAPLATV